MEEGIGIVGSLIYLAILIVLIAGYWKTFEKAGQPGWASIIPIYNVIVLLRIISLYLTFNLCVNTPNGAYSTGTCFCYNNYSVCPKIFFLIMLF